MDKDMTIKQTEGHATVDQIRNLIRKLETIRPAYRPILGLFGPIFLAQDKAHHSVAIQPAKVKKVRLESFKLQPDALRLEAFCLNRKQNYQASLKKCEKFLAEFSHDPLVNDVLFIKTENQYFLNQIDEALESYRQFIPWEGKKGKYSDEARFRIAQCFCLKKKWRICMPMG